ncbi:MAG: SufE family protein [Pseudomonadota bacterium]
MQTALKSNTSIEEIIENFSFLEEWEDRYGYLIELGRDLSELPKDARTDTNKVQGCVSQVWLLPSVETEASETQKRIHFLGASDAHIVSGLVAIALALFSNRTPAEILNIDEHETFSAIGLQEHLTPQRSNGLRSMVQRIKDLAQAAQ